MEIPIIYEDESLIVVDKPVNRLVHHSYYARNIREKSLVQFLEESHGQPLFAIHRLDRKTSGLLLLAKKKEQVAPFQALFTGQKVRKSYLGIVRGFVEETLVIDSPVKHPETGLYKTAKTSCTPIKTAVLNIPVGPYKTARYSLVRLLPATGRTHQLRIHMNKISHPLLGDAKYGDRFHNRMLMAKFGLDSLFLHAAQLDFIHPLNGQALNLQAPLPAHWQQLVKIMGWEAALVVP